jgi:hypothetical protein
MVGLISIFNTISACFTEAFACFVPLATASSTVFEKQTSCQEQMRHAHLSQTGRVVQIYNLGA